MRHTEVSFRQREGGEGQGPREGALQISHMHWYGAVRLGDPGASPGRLFDSECRLERSSSPTSPFDVTACASGLLHTPRTLPLCSHHLSSLARVPTGCGGKSWSSAAHTRRCKLRPPARFAHMVTWQWPGTDSAEGAPKGAGVLPCCQRKDDPHCLSLGAPSALCVRF